MYKRQVLSHSWTALPAGTPASVRLYNGPLDELLARAAQDGCRGLYIEGGKTCLLYTSRCV